MCVDCHKLNTITDDVENCKLNIVIDDDVYPMPIGTNWQVKGSKVYHDFVFSGAYPIPDQQKPTLFTSAQLSDKRKEKRERVCLQW